MGRAAGLRQPFLPALGRVFTTGREAAFTAPGGSLGSRYPALLVSVNALAIRIVQVYDSSFFYARLAAGSHSEQRSQGPGDPSVPAMIASLIARNCSTCSGVSRSINERRTCST
jgi:hypothetical protein